MNVCTAASHLWTFLLDHWYDPVNFSFEFSLIKHHLSATAEAIVNILEISSGIVTQDPQDEDTSETVGITVKVVNIDY